VDTVLDESNVFDRLDRMTWGRHRVRRLGDATKSRECMGAAKHRIISSSSPRRDESANAHRGDDERAGSYESNHCGPFVFHCNVHIDTRSQG
jgi:hypothetical protein